MQVIWSNAANQQLNAFGLGASQPIFLAAVAQQCNANKQLQQFPERYDIEAKAMFMPLGDPRWPQITAVYVYVSGQEKTGPPWNRHYVATQAMVIGVE